MKMFKNRLIGLNGRRVPHFSKSDLLPAASSCFRLYSPFVLLLFITFDYFNLHLLFSCSRDLYNGK